MKRKNHLYKEILKTEHALEMYNTIKHNCKNKKEVYRFSLNLNQNIQEIIKKLETLNYKFDKYRIFIINEPKYRLIMSEKIEDKIVNHLVAKYILLPTLDSSLIDSNVATRYEKGSAHAFKLFLKYSNRLFREKKEIYILKIDISKYFYNIDHEICKMLVRKKIKDKYALKIIDDIIDTTNYAYINNEVKRLVTKEKRRVNNLNIAENSKKHKIETLDSIPMYYNKKGLPIGNMTSQILAVYYLSEVDHYIKEKLKFKNYIRYMDDLIIMDTDKDRLKEGYIKIKEKIESLKLKTNKKSNLYRLSNGVSFLGYTFKNNKKFTKLYIRYNAQTAKRIKRRLKNLKRFDYEKYEKSKSSYKGYLQKCNTSLYQKMMEL